MEKETFYKLAHNPSLLGQDTLEGLKQLTEDFPNFHAAWVLYLRNLKDLNHPEFETMLKKAAPLLPDRRQLYRFLHASKEAEVNPFNPGKATNQFRGYTLDTGASIPDGDSLIDKFLSISTGSLKLNKPIEENQSIVPGNDIIARSVTEDDDLVTETLANIYMGQKKYDKALEAFKKLSLKYPEKNSYFASRIKEIEKLKNI